MNLWLIGKNYRTATLPTVVDNIRLGTGTVFVVFDAEPELKLDAAPSPDLTE